MRLLLLMNMYPPHSDGGYPLLCKETVEALEARGHQILVLTSRMGLEGGTSIEGNVWRVFDYCPDNAGNELRSGTPKDLWHWYRREWVELGLLQRALTEFKPQATFIWATKGMSYSLAIRLLREPLPSFAYVCGYWLHDHNNLGHLRRQYTSWHWDTTSSVRSWFRRVLRRLIEARGIAVDWVPLQLDHLAFNSEAILADLNPACSRTAPVKIVDSAPVERFAQVGPSNIGRPRRILFVGRLHPSKDPLTLVRAFGLLQARPEASDAELTLVGWQHDKPYMAALQDAIDATPNPSRIRISDPAPFDAMPGLFAAHDILVVPSQVDPLPRVAAEGMAAGLPTLVSDQTGISKLLQPGYDALVFPAGNAAALAQLLADVMGDRTLAQGLSDRGRRRALDYFSTKRMVDEIEAFLAVAS